MWKTLSIVAIVLVVGIGIRWGMDGAQVFTKNKEQVVTKDPMFGTETVTWKPDFRLGLDIAGPSVVILLGIGVYGVYRSRKD